MATHSNISNGPDPLDPALTVSFDETPEQRALIEALNEYHLNNLRARELRRYIIGLAPRVLASTGKTWLGKLNLYYLGPDVDNSSIIFVWGRSANTGIKQMVADGKRSSQRKRTTKK